MRFTKLPTVMYRKVDILYLEALVCTVSALVHMLSVTIAILPFLQWAKVQALRRLSLLKMQVSSGRLWTIFFSTKLYHAFTNHAAWKEYCPVFVTKDFSWICLFSAACPPTTHINLQFITLIIHDVEYNSKGSSLCTFFLSSVRQNLLTRNMSHLNE